MAKYIFSQGQVYIEEGAYTPILHKEDQIMHSTVLLIVREGNGSETTSFHKDQSNDKSQSKKE